MKPGAIPEQLSLSGETASKTSYINADEKLNLVRLLQPETRPILHDQLVVDVKGIYVGLVMMEAKCIDVNEKQSLEAQEKNPFRQTRLSNEQ